MRVYLTKTVEFELGGAKHVARGRAFYEAPEGIGDGWVVDGIAFNATEENRVIAYRGLEEVLVDPATEDGSLEPGLTPLPVEPPPPVTTAPEGASAAESGEGVN